MPFIKKQPITAPTVIELTITEMVRWNVHSILRNFVAEDVRVAQEIEEYLKKIGSKKVRKINSDNTIIFEEDGTLRENLTTSVGVHVDFLPDLSESLSLLTVNLSADKNQRSYI